MPSCAFANFFANCICRTANRRISAAVQFQAFGEVPCCRSWPRGWLDRERFKVNVFNSFQVDTEARFRCLRRTRRSGASAPGAHARALDGPKAAWQWLRRARRRAVGRRGWVRKSPRRAGLSPPASLSPSERSGSSRQRHGRARCASRRRAARRGLQLRRPGAGLNIGLDNGLHSAQEGTSFGESRLGFLGWSPKSPKNLSKNLSIAVRVRSDR